MSITREMLMAYADDQLDPQGRALVERALAEDPALAETIERHRRLRSDLARVYDGKLARLLTRPVAHALVAQIRSAPLAPPRDWLAWSAAVRARFQAEMGDWTTPRRALPLLASVALGIVLGTTLFGRGAPTGLMVVADSEGLRARGALDAALTERLTGDPMTENLGISLSFRDKTGAYCRAFIVHVGKGLSGFACREAEVWRVRMTLAGAPPVATGDLRPAGTALPRAVLSAMEDAIDGDALDADGEAAARDRGWRG